MSRSSLRKLPPEEMDRVVKQLYTDAERLDWDHLPSTARTLQYDRWVSETDVGAVLTRYMTSENARSWIKDGPMKEFGRARMGTGRYARYGWASGPSTQQVVDKAVGHGAVVVDHSTGVKPMHCIAQREGQLTYVAWGTEPNLRYLVWSCINHLAGCPDENAAVVILETFDRPVTADAKRRHANIARRCSITFEYLRLASATARANGRP